MPRAQEWAHLDAVKRPKTRGFWGSRVWRRKTSSAGRERGVAGRWVQDSSSPRREALTQLVKVCLRALGPGDGAQQAGLEERAPAVDEATLPSNVVLMSKQRYAHLHPPTQPSTSTGTWP